MTHSPMIKHPSHQKHYIDTVLDLTNGQTCAGHIDFIVSQLESPVY